MLFRSEGSVLDELNLRDAGQAYRPLTMQLYGQRGLKTSPSVADVDAIKQRFDIDIDALTQKWNKLGELDAADRGRLAALTALRRTMLSEAERALPQSETYNGVRMSKYAKARAFETDMRREPDIFTRAAQFRTTAAHDLRQLAQESGVSVPPSPVSSPYVDPTQARLQEAMRTCVAQGMMQDLQSARALNAKPLTTIDRFLANFGPVRQPVMEQTFGSPTSEALQQLAKLQQARAAAIRDMTGNSTTVRQGIDAIAAQQDALPEVRAMSSLGKFLHGGDRKSTRLNSSHIPLSRMPSSA